jgi:hypothetical protein
MILCCRCEYAPANRRCTVCHTSNDEGLFCYDCSKLHQHSTDFSGHSFVDVPQTSSLCSNCDHSQAKFYCLDCPPNIGNFCLGCSIIHPKVKATRNHRVHLSIDKGIPEENVSGYSLSVFGTPKLLIRNILQMTPIVEFSDVLLFFEVPDQTMQFSTLTAICGGAISAFICFCGDSWAGMFLLSLLLSAL